MKLTSSIELLEARIAPAGVVAAAYNAGTGTHRFQVTGDTTLTGGGKQTFTLENLP